MKKSLYVLLVGIIVGGALVGCGKKQESLEDLQAPMSIESLSTMTNESSKTAVQVQGTTQSVATPAVTVSAEGIAKLEPLPPAGPYKPSGQEVQTALRNAGFYTGAVDGKIGPMSKKAIEEFQKANNLQADGKVGPKTWAVLSTYLNTVAVVPATKKK